MTAEEQTAWSQVVEFQTVNNGYWREQATRPQTLGYALTDSPVGLAAWIFEKFHAWTDNHGKPQDAIGNDRMLDNISTYWFTETIASSMRLYLECAPTGPGPFNAGKIDLPIAASIFPREIFKAPRSWAEQLWSDIVYWNEVDRGGHFAPWNSRPSSSTSCAPHFAPAGREERHDFVALIPRAKRSQRLRESTKCRPPLPARSSGVTERHETTAMPLKQRSPRRLLIAQDERPSKRTKVSLVAEREADPRHPLGRLAYGLRRAMPGGLPRGSNYVSMGKCRERQQSSLTVPMPWSAVGTVPS
ncbi:MAG: hypothetical protein ACLP8S_04290 [Solirubrobacteraceae bacterium]